MKLRNNINQTLIQTSELIRIATISKSISEKKLILTTTAESTAEQLLAYKQALQKVLAIKTIYKNETWYKIIAHDILYEPFQKDMQKLQTEIETYNKIRLA